MAEILETAMLICFGFSWPMNVYKNYRARTARSMSLGFILLILCGYAAGISAKISAGRVNYVLAVYVVNFVIVSVNLAVYFRNRALDRAVVGTVDIDHPIP